MWKYIILLLLAVSSGLIAPVDADGIIIVDPPPGVDVRLGQALAIKYHHVDLKIKDQVATTRVDQVFVNDNPWAAEGTYIFPLPENAAVSDFVMWVDGKPVRGEILEADQVATTRVDQVFVNDNPWAAEGTYIFPLPENAAVSDFVMWVDGKPVRGEILEADQARAIYNDIVRRMKDPALLEYVGRKALKASVFPIPPGEERKIELEYSQILPVENGLVHYIYPLSTERFSARPLQDLVIRGEIESREALKAVYSSSHEVSIDRADDYHALLGLEQTDVLPEKDFELYYTISSEKVGLNLLSYKEAGQDGFFLLLAAPDVSAEEGEIVAKDVILVMDTSGSMRGEKIEQAREAAKYVLGNLNPDDRFGIVSFSTSTKAFSSNLEPASQAERGEDFVNRLEAVGSTDINRALLEAVEMADATRPTTLIFLTDGLPTDGVQDIGSILGNVQEAAPGNVRIFGFGVGDDVDTDLLDQLSLDHGGSSTYVRPGQKIDEELSAFYSKVSTPVLSDVELDFGEVNVDQIYPQRIPDLFAGSQLILVGRYREGGPAEITLTGTVNGERRSYIYQDVSFRKAGGDGFIPRLWATRAVGYYLTQIRLRGEKQEWIDSIVALSTRYGIITPYTSFLIQEDDIFSTQGRQDVAEGFRQVAAREAAAPSSGAGAVEKAAFEGALSAAPAELPAMNITISSGTDGATRTVQASEVVKHVGSKSFLLRNETWIDTTFDTSMKTKEVLFLGPEYFDLISDEPELGSYFALGDRVIVVYQLQAYEVVSEKSMTTA